MGLSKGGAGATRTGDPTVTPPGGGYKGGGSPFWAWDAGAGVLAASQSPATYFRTHLQNGNTQCEFAATVGIAHARITDPAYSITDPFGPTETVYIPSGTQPGGSTDHHLAVTQPDGTDVGMWLYNATNHTVSGIGRVLSGAVSETSPAGGGCSGSNAAFMDLIPGLVTTADLASGVPHTLLFGVPTTAVNNSLQVYPAGSLARFNDPNCPYGTWLRLDPNGVVPNYGTDVLAKYIDTCLRSCGMVCRDQSSAGSVIWGQDYINQTGNNVTAWSAAGVTLNLQGGGDSYKIGLYLSTLIPWTQLQVLNPPAH